MLGRTIVGGYNDYSIIHHSQLFTMADQFTHAVIQVLHMIVHARWCLFDRLAVRRGNIYVLSPAINLRIHGWNARIPHPIMIKVPVLMAHMRSPVNKKRYFFLYLPSHEIFHIFHFNLSSKIIPFGFKAP